MNMKKEIRNAVIIVLMCFSFILLSCKKDSNITPGTGGQNEVSIQSGNFSPGTITIPVGGTVTWINNDGIAHTVTSDDAIFDSGNMENGATFPFTFPNKGTFNYHCAYHGGMTGKVIVE
jgi:plastocyanin